MEMQEKEALRALARAIDEKDPKSPGFTSNIIEMLEAKQKEFDARSEEDRKSSRAAKGVDAEEAVSKLLRRAPGDSMGTYTVSSTGEPQTIRAANFMQVLPDSHFWTSLDMMLTYFRYLAPSAVRDYIIVGLENMQKNGYEVIRIGTYPVDSSFGESVFEGNRRIKSIDADRFVELMYGKQPKELWNPLYSQSVPCVYLRNYKSTKSVPPVRYVEYRFHGAGEDAPWKSVDLKYFYKIISIDGGPVSNYYFERP